MAKSARQRAMPRTPQERPTTPPAADLAASPPGPPAAEHAPAPAAPRAPTSRPTRVEPEYLIAGTRCTAGHTRGQELDAGRLGLVPSRKRARIGFGLVLWCVAGMAVLAAAGIASWTWSSWGAQVALLWLAFAAFVVRRA
ncbi:MAG TPA: hypothetical protein VLQ92_08395, partial [Candidatus Limnocylindrales bacterium]|nr:hypothetical protein [Candidatus Limnocylindrales bacterium]